MSALSNRPAHPALISERDFVAAQQIRAARPTQNGRRRRFALAGPIKCGLCGRRLDSHWNHGRPTYRCRHGHSNTQHPGTSRLKTLYIREDHLIDRIAPHIEEVNDEPTQGQHPITHANGESRRQSATREGASLATTTAGTWPAPSQTKMEKPRSNPPSHSRNPWGSTVSEAICTLSTRLSLRS